MTGRAKGSGPISELGRRAQEITQTIVEGCGIQGKALVVEDSAARIIVEVVTPEAGLFIGTQGEMLNAVQILVRAITTTANTERIPIVVDCQGYRSRREETLREQAESLARQVKESGKEAVLEGLSAYERRVIHVTLAEDKSVVTYSEGEGSHRHLVVSPSEEH